MFLHPGISTGTSSHFPSGTRSSTTTEWYCALLAKEKTKEEVMKKILSVIAIAALFCLTCFASRAQDPANEEKTFKANCAAFHVPNRQGNTPINSPSITAN